MTNERSNLPGPNEMVDAWVQAAAETERRWNEFFNQVMGTDAFAQWMARSAEGYAAMQAAFARGMEPYLRALNIPTQTDLAKIAERVTALESRLDALAAANSEDKGTVGAGQPAGRQQSRGGRRKVRGPSETAG
jgi:hypothetical protein